MFKLLISFCLMICFTGVLAQTGEEVASADSLVLRKGMVISKENNRFILNWENNDNLSSGYYSIERKSNDKDFEVVGVIRVDSSFTKQEWIDEAAAPGRNAYRVYSVNTEGVKKLVASGLAVKQGESSIKFYPNPVDNVLIIRAGFPVDVVILDAQGAVRIPQFKINGLFTLNVSSLEAGIYFIRFINKATNFISQERLIKK